MIKVITGNILDAPEDIIIQQVNCLGVMGAGLALQLRNKYPGMYLSYMWYCQGFENPDQLLGRVHYFFVEEDNKLVKTIINIFGQLSYGRGGNFTDYDALQSGIYRASVHAKRMKKTTAIPYGLGAGLAGGDWGKIAPLFERYFIHGYTKFYKLER